MRIETQVRKIGNSLGIILPKEALDALKADLGATLVLTASPGNCVRILGGDSDFQEKMEIASRCMSRYENALRELAK